MPFASATLDWTLSPVIKVAFNSEAKSLIKASTSPKEACLISETTGLLPENESLNLFFLDNSCNFFISSKPK